MTGPASRISDQPRSASSASTTGSRSGTTAARAPVRPASWEVPGPLTLNHSRPPSDSNRIALDHGRACGCSHSPVRVRPCSAAAAAVHAVASVTKAGEVHRSTGMARS